MIHAKTQQINRPACLVTNMPDGLPTWVNLSDISPDVAYVGALCCKLREQHPYA